MKKKIIFVVLILFSISLVGCEEKNYTIDMNALAQQLQNELPLTDQLSEIKENVIYHLYTLDSKDIEEIQVYISSGATAEEITLLKTKNVSAAKQAIDKRVALKRKDFDGYLPKELEKLNDPVVVTKGNYVILCITSDPELARKIIANY